MRKKWMGINKFMSKIKNTAELRHTNTMRIPLDKRRNTIEKVTTKNYKNKLTDPNNSSIWSN